MNPAPATPAPGLTSPDLAPVPLAERSWGTGNYAALWISMSLCIPTYMLASSLIEGGMNWWQALLTIFLGNSIVLVPMLLNGRAGARYGIPFPVFARASFGVRGANVPALLRAIIACGWFGIQTWIGGYALYQMAVLWVPGLATLPAVFPASWGLATGPALLFSAVLVAEHVRGVPGRGQHPEAAGVQGVLPAAGGAGAAVVGHRGRARAGADSGTTEQIRDFSAQFWAFFFPSLTGMVGFWATLSLNIPDFTRYATSQRAQQLGQALGLPTSMTLFSFVGVVVTSATLVIYGHTIWDPVVLAGKFDSKLLVSAAMLAVALSTLATNIAANIVSPANDFANFSPAAHQLQNRRLPHRRHRPAHLPLEAHCRPLGLHFHLAGGLFGAAGAHRRHHDCRLLPHPPPAA